MSDFGAGAAVDLALRLLSTAYEHFREMKIGKKKLTIFHQKVTLWLQTLLVLKDLSPAAPISLIYSHFIREFMFLASNADIEVSFWNAKFSIDHLNEFDTRANELFQTAFDLIKMYPPTPTTSLLRFDRPASEFWLSCTTDNTVGWLLFESALKSEWSEVNLNEHNFQSLKSLLAMQDEKVSVHSFYQFLMIFGPWNQAHSLIHRILTKIEWISGCTEMQNPPTNQLFLATSSGGGIKLVYYEETSLEWKHFRIKRSFVKFPYISTNEETLHWTPGEKEWLEKFYRAHPVGAETPSSSSSSSSSSPSSSFSSSSEIPPQGYYLQYPGETLFNNKLDDLIEMFAAKNKLTLAPNSKPPSGAYDSLPIPKVQGIRAIPVDRLTMISKKN